VRTDATLSELEFVSILFFDSPLVMATDTQAPPPNTASTKSDGVETGRSAAISEETVRQARAGDIARPQQR
jgi:hypothetical protein